MTDSGQRGILPAENVAAPGPTGAGQTTVSGPQWAHCVFCGHFTCEPVFVGSAEQNSGPGIPHYADATCARTYALTLDAPDWLREQYAGVPA